MNYDAWADWYDVFYSSVGVDDVEFYVELAQASGGPVLEIGCGTGRVSLPIAAAGIDVVGVDFSTAMLEKAREQATKTKGHGGAVEFVQGDMRTLALDRHFPLVIIPARTMNELNRLISDREEPVEILMTPAKGQVMFRIRGGDTVEIVSQLLQGTFPNYEQLIPQSYTTRAVMDLPTVLRAARTASIFARDGSNIIRMHLMPAEADTEPPKVEISARSEEVGDNEDTVDLDEIEGEEGKIAFNSRYLLDVLSVLERGKIALETTTSSSPGVFKPTDSDDYIHVVMPMFVQW